jgi:hypothetical protein
MRYYRRYNPNTKYGRKKAREQAYNNIENYTSEEKKEYNKKKFGCQLTLFIVFLIICFLILIISGPDALRNWLK